MSAPFLARLRSLQANLRPLFRLDYSLTQLYLRYIGALGSAGYVIFYFLESGMGYRDWLPLRFVCVSIPLALVFYPRHRKLTKAEIAYFEFTGWLLLPVAQSFLFLLNGPDAYWSSSITLVGLGLGLLTKPFWFPIHLATGLAAGTGLYMLTQGPPDPEALRFLIRLQANAALVGMFALGFQLGLQPFHRRGVELAAGRDPTDFEPVEKDMAVLFCDLRDFTALTEILGPREKQAFLNRYFSLMTIPWSKPEGRWTKSWGTA